jgi:hypothetical protein
MLKKRLHSVLILLLVLAIPFGNLVAKPLGLSVTEKKAHASASKKTEEPVKELLQPQVVHVQVSHVHVLLPTVLDDHHAPLGFCTEDIFSTAIDANVIYLSTTKFFKTLFRHFIATQAP